MQKGKVNIAQGSPKSLSKLKRFLEDMKDKFPEAKLKTHEDGIVFAIDYINYHDTISKNFSMSSLERLGKLTKTNETYDDLITRILDEREEADKRIRELEEKIQELEEESKEV